MTRKYPALRLVSASVAAVLSLAVCQTATTAQADEAPLRIVLEQFTNAWNRGDARAAAATFTAGGVLIAGEGTRLSGRPDIERYLATLPTGRQFTSTVTSVRFLTSNVAILESEGGFLLPGETAVAPERMGIQSIVLVRDGATWQVALAQRTRILPPAKPTGR
jgi:uncharacterized protein (TIGR02246 family)